MPETVRMALARCCQRQTNVTVQEKKVSWSLPLDKGHFITGGNMFTLRVFTRKPTGKNYPAALGNSVHFAVCSRVL